MLGKSKCIKKFKNTIKKGRGLFGRGTYKAFDMRIYLRNITIKPTN
jgi:hypothetical protein